MNPEFRPSGLITMISRDPYLIYSGMYPGVVAGFYSYEESKINLKSLAKTSNVVFIQSEVNHIDEVNKYIQLNNRPAVPFSSLSINVGTETATPNEFYELITKGIACPVKPFSDSIKFIASEDKFDNEDELPFVVIGAGLSGIELILSLRKRWINRKLILVSRSKLSNKISRLMFSLKINISNSIDFDYKRVLVCTGSRNADWLLDCSFDCNQNGRIITDKSLRVLNNKNIFAAGDCAKIDNYELPDSGVWAVKASGILADNLERSQICKKLSLWRPKKKSLQIVGCFSKNSNPLGLIFFGKICLGPHPFFWLLKKFLDKRFIKRLNLDIDQMKNLSVQMADEGCHGCGSKIPENLLKQALKNANLSNISSCPEDASLIDNGKFGSQIIQSVDGFPSLFSDPWVNGRITALHASSDIIACGSKLISAQAIIRLPAINRSSQEFLLTQSLMGITSVIEEQNAKLIGGHTFESRGQDSIYAPLEMEISLSVNGKSESMFGPWRKNTMREGDIVMLSRELGSGVLFAADMKSMCNDKFFEKLLNTILLSQHKIIDDLLELEKSFSQEIVSSATDITGFGLIGHLKEMISSSNIERAKDLKPKLKVFIKASSLKTFTGVFELFEMGIKSSLSYFNKDSINNLINQDRYSMVEIDFEEKNSDKKYISNIYNLIIDPQTCGPILICCHPSFSDKLIRSGNWYSIGEVIKSN